MKPILTTGQLKLSMSMTLFYSLGIALTIYLGLRWLHHRWPIVKQRADVLITGVLLTLLVLYSFPSFQGNYFYRGAKVELPTEYQQLFSYMEELPQHGRVANFPILTNTGWDMFDWSGSFGGYTGSGFYWYGMAQPLLNRAFDVWSPANETYRNEMVQAVYSQNSELLARLLRKYQISYILIDESIFIADNPNAPLYTNELKELLAELPNIELLQQFGSLGLYQVTSENPSPLAVPSTFMLAVNQPARTRLDRQFELVGNTINGTDYYFPFSELGIEKIEPPQITDESILLERSFTPGDNQQRSFVVADIAPGETIDFNLFTQSSDEGMLDLVFQPILPEFKVNDKTFTLNQAQIVSLPLSASDSAHLQVNNRSWQTQPSSDQELVSRLSLEYPQPIVLTASSSAGTSRAQTYEVVLGDDFWSYYQSFGLPLTPAETYQLSAQAPVQVITADLAKTDLPEVMNCDFEKNGHVNRQFIGSSVRYEANNGGAICDSITFSPLPNQTGYILHVSGQNISGLSPKLLVKNLATGRNDLEYQLSPGTFSDYFVLLPGVTSEDGYAISWENRSFGDEETINQIDTVELYTYPVSMLLGSFLSPTNQTPVTQTSSQLKSQPLGTGLYRVAGQLEQPTFLVLSEAFDPWWIAIQGTTILPHHQYNGWANAWLLPEGDNTIFIVYLPQLVTWAGYGLLIVTGTLLGIGTIISYRKHRTSRSL